MYLQITLLDSFYDLYHTEKLQDGYNNSLKCC